MPILPFNNVEHVIYEHTKEGKLFAVEKSNTELIKAFFKKNKSKKAKPSDEISGYWFVMDEEYNSLKIDFSEEIKVEIRELVLFPLK
ncbi:MAG: hypothetical protein ACPGVD_10585 [Flavobacteriales bacterium]